eukprot:jgi/Orpsp1_1/1184390/evm.model.c7180000089324.1
MSAEVMASSEGDSKIATLEIESEIQQIDNNDIQNEDLKDTHINLADLSLNDDSYLNSAIGKDKVFDNFTLKKNKYKYNDNEDDFRLVDKIKTNININSASLNTLASFNSNSNNMLSNSTNLNSYIDDGSLFDLKTSHQLSVVNSNTTIHVTEENRNSNNELNEPHHDLTENEFIDIDLEDKVDRMVNELNDSTDLHDTELSNQDNVYQYDEYDVDDLLVDDDMILKALLNIDNGTTVLLNRVKQNCSSCK